MKIICKKCSAAKGREVEKEPCLFQPRDVKGASVRLDGKLVSICRNCRKQTYEQYRMKSSDPGDWRVSMKAIFAGNQAMRRFPGSAA